jgi:hypothetical protein
MEDDKTTDVASSFGLKRIGEETEFLPVNPDLYRKAMEAHSSETKSIFKRVIKREIDRDEAKRQLSAVREKVKVTYFALIEDSRNAGV